MNTEEIKSALKSEIEPLVKNILSADQAYCLLKTSADFATGLNAGKYGNLFGFLQSIFSDKFILSVTKIFEKESQRYPMHSIPVVIALLEKHQNDLSITERPNFLRVLNDIGLERNKLEGFQDQKVTQMVVAHFRASLPDISKKNGCALSLSLDAVKSIRDKRIAHDENVTVAKLPPVTWDELNGLLAYAKNFIGAIGWGYLSTAYENGSGGYMLSSDALRTSTAMRRLLKQAGIEENETKDA